MYSRIRTIGLTLLFCLPFHAGTADSLTPEQALIKGVAQWQAGRVEKLLVTQVFSQVFEDQYIQRFFPITVRNLIIYDGTDAKRLIPIAEHYLRQDLNNLERLIGVCMPHLLTQSLVKVARLRAS